MASAPCVYHDVSHHGEDDDTVVLGLNHLQGVSKLSQVSRYAAVTCL